MHGYVEAGGALDVEKIRAEFPILSRTVREDKPLCTLKVSVTDSTGAICVEGEATTFTMPLKGL